MLDGRQIELRSHSLYAEDNKTVYVRGNTDLLRKPSIAIVGSRDASDKAIRIAERLGVRFAEAGVNVVSGYARGIDASAHYGALSGEGTTTIVLPTGIKHTYVRKSLDDYWTNDNTLVISEFPVAAEFTGKQAMIRNRTICDISHAVIIVQIGVNLTGGTAGTFRDAKKMGKPVYVIAGKDLESNVKCGNSEAVAQGAIEVTLEQIAHEGMKLFIKS